MTLPMAARACKKLVQDVAGLPIVRQWYVIRRSDKVLLPPAQAMLDFLGTWGRQFLPRTHGRLRLTRSSAPARRS